MSIGYQHQDQAAPEDYYITNSAFIPCVTSANNPTTITGSTAVQAAAGSNINCSNAATPAGTTVGPRYFATSSRTFQQKETSEIRDGAIGTRAMETDRGPRHHASTANTQARQPRAAQHAGDHRSGARHSTATSSAAKAMASAPAR